MTTALSAFDTTKKIVESGHGRNIQGRTNGNSVKTNTTQIRFDSLSSDMVG